MGGADGFQGDRRAAEAYGGGSGRVGFRWGFPAATLAPTASEDRNEQEGEDKKPVGGHLGPIIELADHGYLCRGMEKIHPVSSL